MAPLLVNAASSSLRYSFLPCRRAGCLVRCRVVPGQFLAVDPKGRAVMVGAAEKQKFVYILNRTCHRMQFAGYHLADICSYSPARVCLRVVASTLGRGHHGFNLLFALGYF